jgi:hypothetical protein
MSFPTIDEAPGFRRRFRVTPRAGSACAELEDDFHCMSVTLEHQDGVITGVRADQDRAPWSTCPGAIAQLMQSFNAASLADLPRSQDVKRINCTHLYDLALLAAAHVHDPAPFTYDVLVSDPAAQRRLIELRRNGATVMQWVEDNEQLAWPAEVAGLTLFNMNDWIRSLDPERQEYARVLRWAARIAGGRLIPLDQQSDASKLALSCYSFQPHIRPLARRVGEIRDFSTGPARPLDRRPAVDLL